MLSSKINYSSKSVIAFILSLVFLFSLFGCSNNSHKVTVDTLKTDLSGKEIWLNGNSFLGGTTINPNSDGITNLTITKQLTDKNNGTDEIYADISINSTSGIYSGSIEMTYTKYDQGWQLTSVRRTSDKFTLSN